MSEAVIVEAVRSPGGRYKRGGLAATRGDEIGFQVLKGLLARVPAMKPEEVDDVIVGCAFPEGEQGMNYGRVLAMGAGMPISVSGMTVNRFCSSGLQSIADATAKIPPSPDRLSRTRRPGRRRREKRSVWALPDPQAMGYGAVNALFG